MARCCEEVTLLCCFPAAAAILPCTQFARTTPLEACEAALMAQATIPFPKFFGPGVESGPLLQTIDDPQGAGTSTRDANAGFRWFTTWWIVRPQLGGALTPH
jgi:hypothetical protein